MTLFAVETSPVLVACFVDCGNGGQSSVVDSWVNPWRIKFYFLAVIQSVQICTVSRAGSQFAFTPIVKPVAISISYKWCGSA